MARGRTPAMVSSTRIKSELSSFLTTRTMKTGPCVSCCSENHERLVQPASSEVRAGTAPLREHGFASLCDKVLTVELADFGSKILTRGLYGRAGNGTTRNTPVHRHRIDRGNLSGLPPVGVRLPTGPYPLSGDQLFATGIQASIFLARRLPYGRAHRRDDHSRRRHSGRKASGCCRVHRFYGGEPGSGQ